jgi:putative ABC transport system substrate-binding protein
MGNVGRRRFVVGWAALLAVPIATVAQRADKRARIGFVSSTAPGARSEAFLQGLRDLGYVDGRNVEIELRFADGKPERFPALVDELLRLNVDVLVVGSTLGASAAKKATTTVPVIFAGASDPVAGGIVTNLARPGGNVTGFSLAFGDGFAGKWVELLKECAPGVSHAAAIWSASNAAAANYVQELDTAARKSNVRLDAHQAANDTELADALAAIGRGNARGLVVIPSILAVRNQDRLVQFAADKHLPAIYFAEEFADAGGLMSYGPSYADAYRRSAGYVDRILKGAKPGELPVQQPTKFDLVVNLRAARALGLTVPRSLLLRADRVIE